MDQHELLDLFKKRMKIFHSSEDETLSHILEASEKYMKDYLHIETIEDPRVRELVFERARYAYNDRLEYFNENFQSNLMTLALEYVGDENEL